VARSRPHDAVRCSGSSFADPATLNPKLLARLAAAVCVVALAGLPADVHAEPGTRVTAPLHARE
jgi:hypothetical protein